MMPSTQTLEPNRIGYSAATAASAHRTHRNGWAGSGRTPVAKGKKSNESKETWRATPRLEKEQFLTALMAFKRRDFSYRLPGDLPGIDGQIADAFNDVMEITQRMAGELVRISRVMGRDGMISQRTSLGSVRNSWLESIALVNALLADLVHPTGESACAIGAAAKADLAQTMALDIERIRLKGECS